MRSKRRAAARPRAFLRLRFAGSGERGFSPQKTGIIPCGNRGGSPRKWRRHRRRNSKGIPRMICGSLPLELRPDFFLPRQKEIGAHSCGETPHFSGEYTGPAACRGKRNGGANFRRELSRIPAGKPRDSPGTIPALLDKLIRFTASQTRGPGTEPGGSASPAMPAAPPHLWASSNSRGSSERGRGYPPDRAG